MATTKKTKATTKTTKSVEAASKPAPRAKVAKEAKPKSATKAAATPAQPMEKLSQIAAAERVLAEAKVPLTCKAMVDAMSVKGYWSSPGGKTPEATLYASLLRHIRQHGDEARFAKVDRGLFTLSGK